MSEAPPTIAPPLHIVVMGVAGCGKSVVGEQLAERLALPFLDSEDFHPAAHAERTRAGEPLTPADRAAWLQCLAEELRARPQGAVLACPALRRCERDVLRAALAQLHFLHLSLTEHQALERLAARTDHFYPPSRAARDFEALEDPSAEPRVHVADATRHVARIVDDVAGRFPERFAASGAA